MGSQGGLVISIASTIIDSQVNGFGGLVGRVGERLYAVADCEIEVVPVLREESVNPQTLGCGFGRSDAVDGAASLAEIACGGGSDGIGVIVAGVVEV